MTTPASLNRILSDLRERIELEKRRASESSTTAMNSFGAGYDQGHLDALTEIFVDIMGEQP